MAGLTSTCGRARPHHPRGSVASDSEAVRTALREAAASRRARSSIAREVERLAADDVDRAEMRAIPKQMDDLAPGSLD